MQRSFTFVLLLIVCFNIIGPLAAQENISSYVVIGNQAIPARTCAHLNYAVTTPFAPGTVLSIIGPRSGESVSGSDEWIRVDLNGEAICVHRSQVEAIEDGSPLNESIALQDDDPEGERKPSRGKDGAAQVYTDQWVEYSRNGFSLLAPPDWMSIEELVADEEFWQKYLQAFGMVKTRQLRSQVDDAYEDYLSGAFEILVMDPWGSASLIVSTSQVDPALFTPPFMLQAMATFLANIGAEVIELELAELPAGQGAHYVMEMSGSLADVYTIVINNTAYTLEFAMASHDTTHYSGYIETIANSFRVAGNGMQSQFPGEAAFSGIEHLTEIF